MIATPDGMGGSVGGSSNFSGGRACVLRDGGPVENCDGSDSPAAGAPCWLTAGRMSASDAINTSGKVLPSFT
jgi:hypothetical protein